MTQQSTGNLTDADLATFAALRIGEHLLRQAHIERMSDAEARERFGIRGNGDVGGVVFPYFDPLTGYRVTARVRRDHPEIENGKQKNKYLSAYADRRCLYFVPGCADLLNDQSVPIILVEAEKSALALTAWSARSGSRLLPVAMGGCYSWRGRIGKVDQSDGSRADEVGPLPDLHYCNDRLVIIMLDANVATSRNVKKARFDLARELARRNSTVLVASLPEVSGVNGPDDCIGVCGDVIMADVINAAVLVDEIARRHLEQGIRKLANDTGYRLDGDERELFLDLLSDVRDNQQREILLSQFAKVYRDLSKQTIKSEVDRRRAEHENATKMLAEAARTARLRNIKVNLAELIEKLVAFFADRAYLPEGGALMLAFFALNTWVYDIFDTTPFLNVESPVPGCGKSTVLSLLQRICRAPVAATALSEATLFRVIHEDRPTFLVDEAEFLEGRSDRAQMIRAIANVAYKRGARVPRCGSAENNFKVEWYEVYTPMVFAIIGGLSGTLLERSIVLHMDKKPRGLHLMRCRERVLNRDAAPLRELVEAYALQARADLTRLYELEPAEGYWPTIEDREAEIWGPLLIHARLAGPDIEARLLDACTSLSRQKTDIQSEEWNRALSTELREVLKEFDGERFSPSDLVEKLGTAETWGAKLARYKADDNKSRASAIGRFIQKFRFRSRQHGKYGTSYLLSEVLEALTVLTPENSVTAVTLSPSSGNPTKTQPVKAGAEKTTSVTASVTASVTGASATENMPLDRSGERVTEVTDFSGVQKNTRPSHAPTRVLGDV